MPAKCFSLRSAAALSGDSPAALSPLRDVHLSRLRVIVGTGQGEVVSWDIAGGGRPKVANVGFGMIGASAFDRGFTRFAALALGQTQPYLVEVPSARQIHFPLKGPAIDAFAMAFSPDGRTLATAEAGRVVLWDVRSRARAPGRVARPSGHRLRRRVRRFRSGARGRRGRRRHDLAAAVATRCSALSASKALRISASFPGSSRVAPVQPFLPPAISSPGESATPSIGMLSSGISSATASSSESQAIAPSRSPDLGHSSSPASAPNRWCAST